MVEMPSFTHPPRGSNFVRIEIWFEMSSFTHPLEVVMLFGLENSKVNTIAAIYTFYLNLKLFKRSTSLNYKCSRVWG